MEHDGFEWEIHFYLIGLAWITLEYEIWLIEEWGKHKQDYTRYDFYTIYTTDEIQRNKQKIGTNYA